MGSSSILKMKVLSVVLGLSLVIGLLTLGVAVVPQEEVEALRQITSTMGATNWNFNADSCQVEIVMVAPQEARVDCECNNLNSSICHVVRIVFKFYSLPGILPPELVKLPYLRDIDFAYNYLHGTLPPEWASMQLNSISLLGNRLSGPIPKELGNITTLTFLNLEVNQFSGTVPSDIGKLLNLETLILSSNHLVGILPAALAELENLTDFRINDNNFSGPLPDVQNWKQLTRLEMVATGLQGPIPSSISLLDKLTDLRISDITGPIQGFPGLQNATGLIRLVLRSCNISGELPAYIWRMRDLEHIDVSFNRLVGKISSDITARSLKLVFLTGNMLSGDIPDSLLKDGSNIDLSYNNLTWQGPGQHSCQQNLNLNVNMYKSSSTENTLKDILPCTSDVSCPKYGCSLHVNCGGDDLRVKEGRREVLYEGDAKVDGGAATLYTSDRYWGFSSTGDFMDDDNFQNRRFIRNEESLSLPQMYTSARLSPLSLTYFSYCLENGEYAVSLHFAEIQFTNDSTYASLGRRIFDIYVQEILVHKDFNIEDAAHGAQTPVVKEFNVSVINNILEISFHWTGKGTTRIPSRGVYGPLISAISVDPYFKTCSAGGRKKRGVIYAAIGVAGLCLVFSAIAVLWWKGYLNGRKRGQKDFEGLELQTAAFTLKQLKSATNNFDSANKIGEGGFGPVYKGSLPDGTIIAVKQLSSKSRQGNREFLNEIGMISCLQHQNLVKLHGCCIEGDQLLLVYEYMENNSLANALFHTEKSQLILDWPTRFKICLGIAKGLAYLHEESRFKIVHRDIKATNVLLDKDLNPKISDFGLAKLNEDEKSHISTRVAGTIGYMAPEYALWGYLSDKADVYSFGVVALEIVSGKNNNSYMPSNNAICLLDWACHLQQSKNFRELLDKRLGSKINKEEAERMVKVALLCTNGSPSLRPTMSEVASMLEGKVSIPEVFPEGSTYTEDLRFKAMRDFHQDRQSQGTSRSQTLNSMTIRTDARFSSTSSGVDFHEIHSDTSLFK